MKHSKKLLSSAQEPLNVPFKKLWNQNLYISCVSEYKFLKQLDYNLTVKSTLKDCALQLQKLYNAS